jgi:CBS domain-containing protein
MSYLKTELKARDIMSPEPVCVSPSTRIRELAQLFEEHQISGAPVINQEGKVVGVVSKTDLIRRCTEGTDDIPPAYLFEVLAEQGEDEEVSEIVPEPLVCVEDFMTEDPLMVSPDVSAAIIARLMCDKRIHRVIVADDEGFPVGLITTLDLLGAMTGHR